MALDIQLFNFFNSFAGQLRIFDALIIFLAEYFQYPLIIIFFLLLHFSGYAKQEKIRIFFITLSSAVIARFGVTEIIRFLYHRPRPFLAFEAHKLISNGSWSFPSGHSAFFFAMAAALYCYNKKWGVGFFIAALFMNISRIIAGVHYPSDILGGMVIGILVGYIIFSIFEIKKAMKITGT